MIRGGDFYAIWIAETGLWSTSEQDAIDLIDRETERVMKEHRDEYEDGVRAAYLWNSESGMIDKWHKYCQSQMRDSFHILDQTLIFSNTDVKLEDYASKRLSYPLEDGDTTAWDKLVSVLYSPAERQKIEWSIGSIVSGDSKELQKFVVFYGPGGTGKSTILKIIEKLFAGYTTTFDAKALGSANTQFALEPFKTNPLVAVQQDGDLSHIEDNTRLNSLVSHELMVVNEKFKSTYPARFECFLFMGTNRPVKITDAKSGIIRRLIDISPTGDTIKPRSVYLKLNKQVEFELGAIAKKCLDVYLDHADAYDDYIPLSMLGASNDFYNFVMDSWSVFKKNDETSLKSAWTMYRTYCDEAKVLYPYPQRAFKEELKNYFREYIERETLPDGTRVRSLYRGFRSDKFEEQLDIPAPEPPKTWIKLSAIASLLDIMLADCPAQEANESGTPPLKWSNSKTKLKDIQTSKLHYVQPPLNHIVLDFDIPDENGEKSLEKNIAEASLWPPTYAEVSKSGKALHLHYIYVGDPEQLSRIVKEHVEVKVFTGNSSLRRCLSLCNDIPVATISSGLPLKEVKKTVDIHELKDEKHLIRLILKCMLPKNDPERINPEGTKHAVDFIVKLLDDAYNSGMSYDVSGLYNQVLGFANMSHNHSDECKKLVMKAHFKSKDKEVVISNVDDSSNVYYDIEVVPNLLLINYKEAEDYTPKDFPTWADYIHELQTNHKPIIHMFNPTHFEVEQFLESFNSRAVDFNGRRYDRTINKLRMMGADNRSLYLKSKDIISGNKSAIDNEAARWGRTDIFDFASAANKKSLKQFEYDMGMHHQEFSYDWDKDLPEDKWPLLAAYCDNDVLATEASFHWLRPDFEARTFLSELTGLSINDTTNQQTTRLIFGTNRNTQDQLVYRNLAEPVTELRPDILEFLMKVKPDMVKWWRENTGSYLPFFPGYEFKNGVSMYRGEEVGEGGYVFAEPGMHGNVGLADSASHHPNSAICECAFGPTYTMRYYELLSARIAIKHKDWDTMRTILDGKLAPYVEKIQSGEISAKALSNALKTAINSVYGLTSASFSNPFRDPRNVDNLIAKRGALFMIDLKHAVQEKGFTVAHIKTDSIKIPDATPEIIQFVMDFGKRYGYSFEHEATYDKMCLVNDAVYIAKYDTAERCQARYGYAPGDNADHSGQWTATGKQFQVPYVFKKLFSREPIEVPDDMCEIFRVTGALYLDLNETLPDVTEEEKQLAKLLKAPPDQNTEKAIKELNEQIARGHDYHFVGRIGQFTPIKPGYGGGILLRKADGRYSAATGSKGYRWVESEVLRQSRMFDRIDYSYYDRLVDEAVKSIEKYGVDIEWFTSEDHYDVPPEGDSHDGV